MSKKIILFLSAFRADASPKAYACPDGAQVTGTQTNEAPVKYLLRKFPDVSEVLCVVTPAARESAWPVFERAVEDQAPGVKVTDIPFRDGDDFNAGPLAQIMALVQKGDEILLETTGGLRDAIMYLLLVSRALSFSGIPTAGAVYANFGAGQIADCSELIRLFDLVGGMQELASFGSVGTLRDYYERQGNTQPEIDALLTAMERLNEDITLCRTGKIDQRIEAFNEAMDQAEHSSDPLLRALLPAFRAKYDKKLTIPGLIKWCVNSNMLQQALTIYKERIPAYILGKRPDLLTVKPNAPKPEGIREYESEEEARFYEHLLKMGRNLRRAYYGGSEAGVGKDYTVTTLEYLDEVLPYSYFNAVCSVSQLRDILMDYLYIRMLRNMINHANDQSTQSQSQLMDYLSDYRYKRLDSVTAKDIKEALNQGLKNLNSRPKKERKR